MSEQAQAVSSGQIVRLTRGGHPTETRIKIERMRPGDVFELHIPADADPKKFARRVSEIAAKATSVYGWWLSTRRCRDIVQVGRLK